MDFIFKNIAIIVSFISTIGSFLFMINKKDKNKENEYYKKIVLPYISTYVKNENLNVLDFLKDIIDRKKTYIPMYIFYLYDRKSSEELKKVLVIDYMYLYDNQINKINRALLLIANLIYYLFVFLCLFLFIFSIFMLLKFLFLLIIYLFSVEKFTFSIFFDEKFYSILFDFIRGVVFFILAIVFTKIAMLYFKVNDRYTLSKKHIEGDIEKKLKKYETINKKYYFSIKVE